MQRGLGVDLRGIGIGAVLQQRLHTFDVIPFDSVMEGRATFYARVELGSVAQQQLNAFGVAGTGI